MTVSISAFESTDDSRLKLKKIFCHLYVKINWSIKIIPCELKESIIILNLLKRPSLLFVQEFLYVTVTPAGSMPVLHLQIIVRIASMEYEEP